MSTGPIMLTVASLAMLHAAFSAQQYLSRLKALGKPEGSLPNDIVGEVIIAIVLGIIGACYNIPPLKEITWASEMRKCTIDQMDSRLGFASYVNRGKRIFGTNRLSK